MAYRCQYLFKVGKGEFILLRAGVPYAVVLLLVSIKDLPIPLVANFIPEDVLTVISPGKNVKYMIPGGYPHYSGQVSIPPISIFHIRIMECLFPKLRLKSR